MYKLKPVLQNTDVDLPTCMYKLKPINSSLVETMESNSKNSQDVSFF